MRHLVHCRVAVFLLAASACGGSGSAVDENEALSGGDATVFQDERTAFGFPVPDLTQDEERSFLRGRALFRDDWVVAPASTDSRDGLGPVFNARSCDACHIRDGRGRPPMPGQALGTILLRLSVPGMDETGAPLGDPSYGDQLQPLGIPDVPGEGSGRVEYQTLSGEYADGTPYELRRPSYSVTDLSYGALASDVMISPRVTPVMIGLGLLEAIPEATLQEFADPVDDDGDGISGRLNQVWNAAEARTEVGRFGLKANQPNVRQQTAGAFVGDIGITSSVFGEGPCAPGQEPCASAANGGEPELLAPILDDVAFYSATIGVPARRNVDDPEVRAGKKLFQEMGCESCHLPKLDTGPAAVTQLSNQTIRPFTDLLLHDMGEGLADNRPDFLATGSEWRTPPLWGIGLVETVNEHLFLLHDGRARGFAEAILWHGGEAEFAKEEFRNLAATQREQVIRFLESL